jgi:hypothetical protein
MTDRRPTLIIPRDEETVRAEADKRYRGDTEKVSTTLYRPGDVLGVGISSRYDKAREYEVMAALIRWIPPDLRALMSSIDCDSKSTTWTFFLKKCSANEFSDLTTLITSGLYRLSGGHNGVFFHFDKSKDAPPNHEDLDPLWYEGSEDDDYFNRLRARADEILKERYNGDVPELQRPEKAPE